MAKPSKHISCWSVSSRRAFLLNATMSSPTRTNSTNKRKADALGDCGGGGAGGGRPAVIARPNDATSVSDAYVLIRVRTNVGLWRVPNLTASSTVADLQDAIAVDRRPMTVEYTTPLCSDPGCTSPLGAEEEEAKTRTLGELGLRNGSMVYCGVVSESRVAGADGSAGGGNATMKRIVGKDGSIELITDGRGFRTGQMTPLRDVKMQWSLAEVLALNKRDGRAALALAKEIDARSKKTEAKAKENQTMLEELVAQRQKKVEQKRFVAALDNCMNSLFWMAIGFLLADIYQPRAKLSTGPGPMDETSTAIGALLAWWALRA
jgi:hypothetical protein